jgi:hypothetical protein
LSSNTTDPDNPDTDPPTEYELGADADALSPAQLSAVAAPKVMIPGAPPVNDPSVTAIRSTPFSCNEMLDPTALNVNCVPAANGPHSYELPS